MIVNPSHVRLLRAGALAAFLMVLPAALPGQEAGVRAGDRCSRGASTDSGGVVAGTVVHAGTDRLLPGAEVELLLEGGRGAEASGVAAVDTADSAGSFTFCRVPRGTDVRFRVTFAGTASDHGPVARSGAATRTEIALELGAPAFLVFTVRERDTGDPVRGATVRLDPLRAGTVTDSSGHASVRNLPPGRYAVTVEHIALRTTSDTVDVDAGLRAEIELRVPSRVVELEPLEVMVTDRNPYLVEEGFYDRMGSDRGGHFMTPDSVASRDFARRDHFLRFVPNIQLRIPDSGCYAPYVNGVPAFRRRAGGGWRETALWRNLRGWRVLAVEAYRQGEEPPAYENYRWESPDCAVIVFWVAPPGTTPPARKDEGRGTRLPAGSRFRGLPLDSGGLDPRTGPHVLRGGSTTLPAGMDRRLNAVVLADRSPIQGQARPQGAARRPPPGHPRSAPGARPFHPRPS